MKRIIALFAVLVGLGASSCSTKKVVVNGEDIVLEEGVFALLETSMGDILVELNTEKAPMTAANFVALAEGTHPEVSEEYKGKPYYDGIIFHRVIPNFMVQCGDPTGTGAGSPGYEFPQEIHEDLTHEKGVISMANAGPNTNGAQFFITTVPTPHLDGGYNVFGKVYAGQHVADSISNVERNSSDRPVEKVILNTVTIVKAGASRKYDGASKFVEEKAAIEKRKQEEKVRQEAASAAMRAEHEALIEAQYPEAIKTPSGLYYIVTDEGSGVPVQAGQKIQVHYAGYLMDGKLFDTSIKSLAEELGIYDARREPYPPFGIMAGPGGRVIQGWQEGLLLLNMGGSGKLIIPPHLGYGARGAGDAIPPNAIIVFDIQIVE